eukprot:74234_1
MEAGVPTFELSGSTDMDLLRDLSGRSYKEQAQFALNAFWNGFGKDNTDQVWEYSAKMSELDERNGAEGCELDEMTAHRFLEVFEETLTVREMRAVLKDIDIDTNKNVSLAEYLIFRFKLDWHELVHSIQGGNPEEIERAKSLLSEAMARVTESQERAASARQAETDLGKARRQAQAAEAEVKEAEVEVKKSADEVRVLEDAQNKRLADLEAKTKEGGQVSRNKAVHELAQAKAEDPLPLRRAKITAEAAEKRAEKASRAAAEETRKVEAALEEAKRLRQEADAAVEEARRAMAEAEKYLNKVKNSMPQGTMWWITRELEEQKKFLPQSKGGKTGDEYWKN